MKAKDVKEYTKKLKKVLDKIHAMDDTEEVPAPELKKLDQQLDQSLFDRGRSAC
jgi:hypothetical protein